MRKVLVGVTMYNCENQIENVYLGLKDLIDNLDSSHFAIEEVIFLDNQSTDLTVQRAQSIIPANSIFKVCKNIENYGLGGSHKSLFLYARSKQIKYVAIVHGDNQADSFELKTLLDISSQNNFCTVLGARFMKSKSLLGYSYFRTIGNRGLNLVYSFILNKKIYDLGSGLNLFNVAEMHLERVLLFDDHFTFNMDLLINLVCQKIDFKYTPIRWKSEDEVSNAKTLQVGWTSLIKILKWSVFKENIWQGTAKKYIFNFI